MKDSKYQIRIYDEYDNTRNNIAIEAVPGSGKTTTLLRLLKRTPINKKCIFLAFNKSIADELSAKVADFVEVSTLHSLGFKILRSQLKKQFKVNEFKNWILLKEHVKKKFKNEKEKNVYIFTISRLYDLYRMNLCDKVEDIIPIAESRSIEFSKDDLHDLKTLVSVSYDYNHREYHKDGFMVDYTDMIFLTKELCNPNLFKKYDVAMIDESQDLNRLHQYMLFNIVKRNGRFIAVGDESQSIYGFQGSTVDVFKDLKATPNTVELPLSVCYRCDKKIVAEANKVFDKIEAFEEKEEGVVRHGTLKEIKEGDFLLCRNNLPLMQAYIELLKQNKRAFILGKDLGRSLLKIVSKVSDVDIYDAEDKFSEILKNKREELKGRGVTNINNNKSYVSVQENISIIKILGKEFEGYNKVAGVIESLFKDKRDGDSITLSTIHKAKGLEADRVFILGLHELIPSKYARTSQELFGEYCLKYVAISRAKHELVYVPLSAVGMNVEDMEMDEVEGNESQIVKQINETFESYKRDKIEDPDRIF